MNNVKRSIVITGALRGLGYELSKCLIKDNNLKLILTSRNAATSQKILDELKLINPSCAVDYHQLQIDSKESIDDFVSWIKETYGTVDILLNNAAVIDREFVGQPLGDAAFQILNTNVNSTVNLTEAMLPVLSKDAKILIVSSNLGQLEYQDESIQKELNNPDITMQDINQKIADLIQMRKDGTPLIWKDQHTPHVVYCASKCLINAYSRFVLIKLKQPEQTIIVLHPGWCKTTLGSERAPLTPEQGTVSMLKAINDIPFGQSEKYNGIFLNESGEPWAY